MAQYRQSGALGIINNGGGGVVRNGVASDHVSVGIRSNKQQQQQSRNHHRRLKSTTRKISIGAIIVILFVAFVVSVSAFFYFTSQNKGKLRPFMFDYEFFVIFLILRWVMLDFVGFFC